MSNAAGRRRHSQFEVFLESFVVESSETESAASALVPAASNTGGEAAHGVRVLFPVGPVRVGAVPDPGHISDGVAKNSDRLHISRQIGSAHGEYSGAGPERSSSDFLDGVPSGVSIQGE